MRHIILGLGKTGFYLAKYFHQTGQDCLIMDNRLSPPYLEEVLALYDESKLILGDFDLGIVGDQKTTLWVSPGLGPNDWPMKEAIDKGVMIKSEIDILMTQTPRPKIIAVSGSNGKSTVVDIIKQTLNHEGYSCRIAGNHDFPAVCLLDHLEDDVWILELSSFQLFYASCFQSDVSVLLNITEDHLDWHRDMECYANAKLKLLAMCNRAVCHYDLVKQYHMSHNSLTTFGNDSNADWYINQASLYRKNQMILETDHMRIKQLNHLAAFAAIDQVGLGQDRSYLYIDSNLPYRCDYRGYINERHWYNDSKATNPAAVCAAIIQIESKLATSESMVVLMGGKAKMGYDYRFDSELFSRVKCVLIYGASSSKIISWIPHNIQIYEFDNLIQAFSHTLDVSQPGDYILFSPACSSFDAYQNYKHRGQHFNDLVDAL